MKGLWFHSLNSQELYCKVWFNKVSLTLLWLIDLIFQRIELIRIKKSVKMMLHHIKVIYSHYAWIFAVSVQNAFQC